MIPKRAQANKEIIEIISEEWALSERDLELVKYTIKKALSLADTPRGTRKKHSYIPEIRYVLNHPTFKGMECAYDEQISQLQTELEKWKKQTKVHEEFIGEKLREIDKLKAEKKEMLEKIKKKLESKLGTIENSALGPDAKFMKFFLFEWEEVWEELKKEGD